MLMLKSLRGSGFLMLFEANRFCIWNMLFLANCSSYFIFLERRSWRPLVAGLLPRHRGSILTGDGGVGDLLRLLLISSSRGDLRVVP